MFNGGMDCEAFGRRAQDLFSITYLCNLCCPHGPFRGLGEEKSHDRQASKVQKINSCRSIYRQQVARHLKEPLSLQCDGIVEIAPAVAQNPSVPAL